MPVRHRHYGEGWRKFVNNVYRTCAAMMTCNSPRNSCDSSHDARKFVTRSHALRLPPTPPEQQRAQHGQQAEGDRRGGEHAGRTEAERARQDPREWYLEQPEDDEV